MKIDSVDVFLKSLMTDLIPDTKEYKKGDLFESSNIINNVCIRMSNYPVKDSFFCHTWKNATDFFSFVFITEDMNDKKTTYRASKYIRYILPIVRLYFRLIKKRICVEYIYDWKYYQTPVYKGLANMWGHGIYTTFTNKRYSNPKYDGYGRASIRIIPITI